MVVSTRRCSYMGVMGDLSGRRVLQEYRVEKKVHFWILTSKKFYNINIQTDK